MSSTAGLRICTFPIGVSRAPGRTRRKAARSRSAGSRGFTMTRCALAVIAFFLAGVPLAAHHEILAKFDDSKRMTLSGVGTLVDWRNPHVHVFMNVRDAGRKTMNWAVELESPIDLQQSGWNQQSVKPGDAVRVEGMAARDGSRQVWGTSLVLAATGRQVLN